MKKKIFTLLAGALALSVGVLAAGCDFSLGGSADKDGSSGNSAESMYGIGAVTTARLLMETDVEAKPLATDLTDETAPDTAPDTAPETTPETTPETAPDYQLPAEGNASTDRAQGEAETFNKYFNMLEGFLEKGATSTTVSENDSDDPALSAFATKLVVRGKNELGEENVHTMYYSETKLDVPARGDWDDDDWDDDWDDDDDEVKTVDAYSVEGVLAMGTDENGTPVYYYMTGSRTTETEQDGRETEESTEFVIRAYADKTDKNNFVMMRHETSSEQDGRETENESEYVYSVYKNGRVVETTSVDFESENSEAEYELEYVKDGVRSYYEIERVERGGKTWLEVEYNIGGDRGKFVIVRDADGNFDYKFTQKSADDRYFDRYDD